MVSTEVQVSTENPDPDVQVSTENPGPEVQVSTETRVPKCRYLCKFAPTNETVAPDGRGDADHQEEEG